MAENQCAHCDHDHHEEKFDVVKKASLIAVSSILFILGLIFNQKLHTAPVLEYGLFLFVYVLSGRLVLLNALRNIIRGRIFDENFLMSIATIGAIAIHQLPEAVGVMIFYQVGEFFQQMALNRSRRSIKSLLALRPEYANLTVNGEIKKVSPQDVAVDQTIVVRVGERIPLDGIVLEGKSQVDTSALTGESVPKTVDVNDVVLAGMINKTGTLFVKVTKSFEESSISKILELVETASSKKAETEKFITKISSYYTPIVVFTALLVAIVPPLLFSGQTFDVWIYRALVLLVISCPCALVISIPMGYFGGIGGAAHKGVLVKGSNFLDVLTEIKTIVFDKTGTLTKGVFKVSKIVDKNGFTKDEILKLAALVETQSNHPIAQSIIQAYGKKINSDEVTEFKEVSGHGIKASVKGREVIVGNDRMLHAENIEHEICLVVGTVVHVAVEKRYCGYILISDELKEDAVHAIELLRKIGIKKVVMLTGDNRFSAEVVATKLGIDSFHSELLPEDKVNYLEKIQVSDGHKVAFVGDGINDAPVLARADVGIAMGALGSDVAVETADIVIMADSVSKIATAIDVAKRTRQIVWQNIWLALIVKANFIVLGSFGVATMWEAVFADMGVALAAIFNSTRLLKG
ncbi:MAG: cadmium-translocating P-type ATPase [Candidatus Omnitrophica bacterium]|nr:cadmium-translocating P-type ATPase [Candidatus Omnitrophota bacterium]